MSEAILKFNVYNTIFDEVESVCCNITNLIICRSNKQIGIIIPKKCPTYAFMFADKLDVLKIPYLNDTDDRCFLTKDELLVSLWSKWQINRDINSFGRFCTELLANGVLAEREFERIRHDIAWLQGRYFSDNYDVMYELANLKGLTSFDILERFNFFDVKIFAKIFHKKFLEAFNDVLFPKNIQCVTLRLENFDASTKFCTKSLISFCMQCLKGSEKVKKKNFDSSVVMVHVEKSFKYNFSHVFFVGMIEKNLDADPKIQSYAENVAHSNNYNANNNDLLIKLFAKNNLIFCSYPLEAFSGSDGEQFPAQIFQEKLYTSSKQHALEKHTSSINMNDCYIKNFLCEKLETNENDYINNCASSYCMRHNGTHNVHEFCFAMDRTSIIRISCKALEYLLKNPHLGFYDTVLNLSQMPWEEKEFNKSIIVGSLTHEFLQIFETKNSFCPKLTLDNFYRRIKVRSERMKSEVARATYAADLPEPSKLLRAIDFAEISAKRLVNKLLRVPGWTHFRSEFRIPSNVIVNILGGKLQLTGRLDFFGHTTPKEGSDEIDYLIVDYKTGSDSELTCSNIKTHMQKYSNLQLVLYGMAMQKLGYKNVGLLILKPDSPDDQLPISLNFVIQEIPDVLSKLAKFAHKGIIQDELFRKIFRTNSMDRLPLATTDL